MQQKNRKTLKRFSEDNQFSDKRNLLTQIEKFKKEVEPQSQKLHEMTQAHKNEYVAGNHFINGDVTKDNVTICT